MRHRIFVGSSKEELRIANAIQRNLVDHGHVVKVWNQGIFGIGKAPLEALIAALDKFDAAVFVFAPNDLLKIRERQYQAVRDNVVFELGLFTGHLGRDRTFWLVPSGEDEMRTASDLLGIMPAEYTPPDDGDWPGALAVACHGIHDSLEASAINRGRHHVPLPGGVFLECAPMLNKVMERMAEATTRSGDQLSRDATPSGARGQFRVKLANRSDLTVAYGRIEDCSFDHGQSVLVLPANEFLDDECITDVRSALGSFVQHHFADRMDEFKRLIARLRAELPAAVVEREAGRFQESFGVGTSLFIREPLGRSMNLILTAATRKRAGEGIKAEPSYVLACLNSISRIMNDEKLTDVYLPLLGSGHGDLTNEVALLCLITGISTLADIRHAHVVLYQRSATSEPSIAATVVDRMLAHFALSA